MLQGGVRTFSAIWGNFFKQRGVINNELIHITDWLPTFYEAAGNINKTKPFLSCKSILFKVVT